MHASRLLLLVTVLWMHSIATAGTPAGALSGLDIDWPKERLAAPPFELETLDGDTLRLEDYRGKLVLINFWATFCAPCRREMPALDALQGRYAEQGLVVLAIAADRNGRRVVAPYIAEHGYRFPVALDAEGDVRKRYEVNALPTSYLVGRDGRFVARVIGERAWDSEIFRELVENLLGSQREIQSP